MRGEQGREESNFSGGGIGQGARKFFERGEKGREKKISEERFVHLYLSDPAQPWFALIIKSIKKFKRYC